MPFEKMNLSTETKEVLLDLKSDLSVKNNELIELHEFNSHNYRDIDKAKRCLERSKGILFCIKLIDEYFDDWTECKINDC